MFRSSSSPCWPIVFLALVLFILAGFCRADVSSIGNFLVSFVPPVTVFNGERLLNCTGVIFSPKNIALSPACVVYAHKLQEKGAVSVRDHQGHPVGRLPAVGHQPLGPAWNLSFVSNLKPDSTFPTLVDSYNSYIQKTATYFLLNPMNHEIAAGNRSVRLKVLASDKHEFSLSGLNPVELEQYPAGSPVVDNFGGVMCLLTGGGGCINGWSGNDGSCHIEYFDCRDVVWNYCANGQGSGLCTNDKSDVVCSILVSPDGADIGSDTH